MQKPSTRIFLINITGLIVLFIGTAQTNREFNRDSIPKYEDNISYFGPDLHTNNRLTTDCVWHNLARSSESRVEALSALVNDKIYISGGFIGGLAVVGKTEIYDTELNTWSLGADMPYPLTHGAITIVEDEIWIIGGFIGDNPGVATDKVQVYNTTLNEWREEIALPYARASGAAAFFNNKIHFFGGVLADRNTDTGDHHVLDLNNKDDGWTVVASLPNPRNHHSAVEIKGKIYAIGGQYGHDVSYTDLNLLHEYDPESDTWTQKANLLSNRSHFEPGTSVYKEQIVIVGGRIQNGYTNKVSIYDPATDSWRNICDLENRLFAPTAKAVSDRLIINGLGLGDGSNTKWASLDPLVYDYPDIPELETDVPTDSTNEQTPSVVTQLDKNMIDNQVQNKNPNLIYPNPVSSTFSINLISEEPASIKLFNLSGKKVRSISNVFSDSRIDISDLNDGVYLVQVSTSSKKIPPQMLIKK